MTESAGERVRRFIARINAMDLEGAQALLSPDFVWENVPMAPPANLTRGGAAMAHRLSAVFALCERVDWVILEQAEDGPTVLHERRDDHWFRPGLFPRSDVLSAPVASVWKVDTTGITLWRDYFDLLVFETQLGMSLADFGAMIGRNYGD